MQQIKERVVGLKNLADRPLIESEIVDATVEFANGARLQIDGLEGDEPLRLVGDRRIRADLAVRGATDDVEAYRSQVRGATRSVLASIIAHPLAQARALAASEIGGLIRTQVVLREPPRPLLTHRYAFATDLDLVLLGRILLADQSRPFQEKLCQCLYSQCGDFFFEMKAVVSRRGGGGMRRRKYCCDEHMNKARDERRTERAQAKRRAPRRPK